MQVHGGSISGADIAAWPCSIGILCKFTAFLETLHWPMGSEDMGHFGVSFLELLILFEQSAGHRLLSEKMTWPRVRTNRPMLIPSVPVSEGIEIRHGCQLISSLVRALAKLPGGIGRFLPCGVGSHMSRLRHLGWNQCSLIINALRLFVGFWCIPKDQLRSFWMALLSSDTVPLFLPRVFSPWSLPRVGNGGKRWSVTLGHLPDDRSNVVEKVRLTRKTRPGASSHVIPDPGHPTPREMEKIAPSFLRWRRGRGGRTSQSFSSTRGWVSFALGTPGTCLRREQA